ncbi:hybrid sensor histidine kinase/response regulator [Caballeronia sp. LP006]|uniref:ATP-binding response regulator n=1 Tax=unclassified Caballeronia TaxID=2646786 RepID=UPI002027BF93|nr:MULTISPECIES: hybrid sensor histidine kinase/response regulator [unclassified Caballeronia]MDR5828418.1 hybrid sensor histidine kinase/response regulator [Caballeronia sp. LP006]
MAVPQRAERVRTPEIFSAAREAGLSLVRNLSIPAAFADRALEAQFLEDHAQRFCAFRRASALLALVIWTCFLWWDFSFSQGNSALNGRLSDILAIRFAGIVLLILECCLVLRPSFRSHAMSEKVILTGIYGLLCLILALFAITPSPYNYTQHFTGLCLALFVQFSFFYLRSRVVLTAGIVTMASIVVLQLTAHLLNPENFFAGLFYMFNVIVVGHGVCVHAERVSRERFSAERALASLNDELRAANGSLARKNDELEISRKDQENKTTALLALREQQMIAAQTASREKSNFLAAATHDLRQPMHALNLFLQAAAEAIRNGEFEQAERLIDECGRSSIILARLLNAVLDLSRLESGRVVPRYHVFDVRRTIEEAVEQLRPFAMSRGVDLRLRLPKSEVVCVRSDAHWLGRAIANLISNGIKYADQSKSASKTAKPTVIVGVVRSPTRARIDVLDNGIGIPADYFDAIFQPFFQVDNPEQDRDKGLGLGLSIVNAVISMLDEHRIELKSTEGRGSRFSLEMPQCGPTLDKPSTRAPALSEANEAAALSGRYVLLVEDDGLVRASTEALLSQWGVLYDSAATFDEFETILADIERFPDLIITDYRLRDSKTAREVAMLGTARLGRPCPCLVVTGEPSATIVPLACEQDVLSKPVSPAELRRGMVALMPNAAAGQSACEAAIA